MSVPCPQDLLLRVRRATGSDPEIDAAIAALDPRAAIEASSPPSFTRSVDACLELLRRTRPGWAWHVGWGATGVVPYVTVSRSERRYEARASTIPLALLDALLQVEIADAADHESESPDNDRPA